MEVSYHKIGRFFYAFLGIYLKYILNTVVFIKFFFRMFVSPQLDNYIY